MESYTYTAAGRIRKFFEDNPGEMLAYSDIGTKWGLTDKQVVDIVRYLKRINFVETHRVITRKF